MKTFGLEERPAFEDLLALVRGRTGVDFSGYREGTLRRRVANRMISVGAPSLDAYLEVLRASEEEAGRLLERLTVKVSRFYRNAAAFDLLRSEVLPTLRARLGPRPARAWCAGCGTGEEAFTLAMLLDDAGLFGTVHATDIDPSALAAARKGCYAKEAARELPEDLRARYLVARGDGVRVHARALWRVRFAVHDLLGDEPPPGAPFHLVTCRNVLIYLQPPAQERAEASLRRAMLPGAYLLLGEAEWPRDTRAGAMEVCSRRERLFRAPAHTLSAP